MKKLSRRDFLKLIASVSAGAAVSSFRPARSLLEEQKPNFVVLAADAMSAAHLSLYGYARRTTPNLERLAGRAIVYHSHYAGGNFTTAGTASILTGSYPWTHRAVNLGSTVRAPLADRNIFNLLGPAYFRAGFTQNILADLFLRQFGKGVDLHIPLTSFIYKQDKPVVSHTLAKDPLMAYYAMDDFLISTHQAARLVPGSISAGYLGMFYVLENKDIGRPTEDYPYGMPSNSFYFYENNAVYDAVRETIANLHRESRPFFAYIHLMSPHSPYNPSREFVDTLADIPFPTRKVHPLGDHVKAAELLRMRKQYDEYIANIDSEMGRLLDGLQSAGILDDTYFFILSDHGEMFERGVQGHVTPLLYEPIVRTPLLVFAPGQTRRVDVHAATSNADILPTVLSLAGRDVPAGEGRLLPGLGGVEDENRPVFSVEAKESSAFIPLSRASVSMVKGGRKIIHYKGYEKSSNAFELYDLRDDNEEKRDLYEKGAPDAARMKEELLDSLAQAEKNLKK